MIFSVVKQVMKCMCHCVPIFAGVFFFFLFFLFYNGPTNWCAHTWRRKAGKSQKGGRRKWNGLQCRETGHETRVPVCANFCWIPLCVFLCVFFTMAPQTGAPHMEKKSWEEDSTSPKGERRNPNDVLVFCETGHEMSVLVGGNFCWFPFAVVVVFVCFYSGSTSSRMENKSREGEESTSRKGERKKNE